MDLRCSRSCEQAPGVPLTTSAPLPAVLGKAVHSLSRIGDELYLEPLKDGVRDWDAGLGADSMVSGEPRVGVHSALQSDGGQVFRRSLFISSVVGTSA